MDNQNESKINYRLFFLYSIGFIILTSAAIWDLNNIITDFIYENRLTLVKQQSIDKKYPYLGKTIITLSYDQQPWFPEPPTTLEDFGSMAKDYWYGNEIRWLKNISDDQKIMATHMFNIIMAYSLISCLDDYDPDNFKACADTSQ